MGSDMGLEPCISPIWESYSSSGSSRWSPKVFGGLCAASFLYNENFPQLPLLLLSVSKTVATQSYRYTRHTLIPTHLFFAPRQSARAPTILASHSPYTTISCSPQSSQPGLPIYSLPAHHTQSSLVRPKAVSPGSHSTQYPTILLL